MDALLDWEPVEDIPHEDRDVVALRGPTNQVSSGPLDPLQWMQTDQRKSAVE